MGEDDENQCKLTGKYRANLLLSELSFCSQYLALFLMPFWFNMESKEFQKTVQFDDYVLKYPVNLIFK